MANGEQNFNISQLAEQMAELKGSDIPAKEPDAQAAAPAPAAEPKEVETEEPKEEERSLAGGIPDRDDIVIRKKGSKTEETGDEDNDNNDMGMDTDSAGDDDLYDDPDTIDTNDTPQDEGVSENFKSLRASQKKFKKMALKLQKEVDNLKPLQKYRDIVDLATSPEFEDKYTGARAVMVNQAETVAELYGLNGEDISSVFEQDTIKAARQELTTLVDDPDVVTELNSIVRDFYINKSQEDKDLQHSDPKERFKQLKEERQRRIAQDKEQRVEAVQLAKKHVIEELEVVLEDQKQAKVFWGGLCHKDLKKYVATDVQKVMKADVSKKYAAIHDSLVEKGANLGFEDNRKIAMLVADASSGLMANKVIGILMDELKSSEARIQSLEGNSNPSIRQSGTHGTAPAAPPATATREEKTASLIESLGITSQ